MKFKSFHFHIYFTSEELDKVNSLVNKLKDIEGIKIGRVWNRPVGPHPVGSCQITVFSSDFKKMTDWFSKNRDDLTIFVHGVSGDDWKDHTDHVLWIGTPYDLNLSFFKKFDK